ncbi:MAG: (d)CMP kinase [Rubrimonas sp.]|uniref:(d)CMP kinase n=1 Tax=Rubrimonas sp. TaxID=2036015 RepID=UPI002FDD0820
MSGDALRFTVAIDGPAAAGKGTIGRAVAERFGFAHLDTGALYRAVAALVLEAGADPSDAARAEACARALDPADLDRLPLRSGPVGEAASVVAAHPQVRAALLEFQRAFSRRPGGAVLDGRDIGTVVCPDAQVKLYVTAAPETRAARRAAELGQPVAQALADLRKRDARDAGRADAPMRAAEDALLLDTTDLAIGEAVAAVAALIAERLHEARPENTV